MTNLSWIGLQDTADGHESLPNLVDAITAARRPGQPAAPAVLIVRGPSQSPLLARARQARGLALDQDVAILQLDLCLTAAAAVKEATELAAPRVPADRLLELVWRLAAKVQTISALSSVAHLVDPVPSLGQHLRSWLPGNSFVVTNGRVISPGQPAVAAWQAGMESAGRAPAPPVACIVDGLAPLTDLLPATTRLLDASGLSPTERQLARRQVQVSWLGEDPVHTVEFLAAEAQQTCRNCQRTCFQAVCPFCSTVTQVTSSANGGDPV